MSGPIKDGGPAFPTLDYITPHSVAPNQDGMTLRDYFAAKALQGLLASSVEATREEFADQAYVMADAMLAAREAQS